MKHLKVVPRIILLFLVLSSALLAKDLLGFKKPGELGLIDYRQFGTVENVGTANFRFHVWPQKLQKYKDTVGEGIYPNNEGVKRNPLYIHYKKEGKLEGSHWDFMGSDERLLDFFKWATAGEDPGLAMYYAATALERQGYLRQALKAYYAVVLHYPFTMGWAESGQWFYFLGPGALAKCYGITSSHPELGLELQDAMLRITPKKGIKPTANKFNKDEYNIVINPGKWALNDWAKRGEKTVNSKGLTIYEDPGLEKLPEPVLYRPSKEARSRIVKFDNGHYQFQLNGEPMMVKAVAYSCTAVGEGPGGESKIWTADRNDNGKVDGLEEAWIDLNKNNKKEKNEPRTDDLNLLKSMGANAVRIYHNRGQEEPREQLKRLYEEGGIHTLMGNFIGMYAVDSGAPWSPGTDYSNPEHRKNMRESIKNMVESYKDEDFVLMWVLGNENNYADDHMNMGAQVNKDPIAYYSFVNEMATMIHEIDGSRPVAICNGGTKLIEYFAEYSSNVDIFGLNAYRGERGFGGLWYEVQSIADRPVLITEYGADAYHQGVGFNEEEQMRYHKGNWEDIMANRFGKGIGNAIGGVAFQYMDEWWKHDQGEHPEGWVEQSTSGTARMPFADGWGHEEVFGIIGQGDGSDSPYMRQLRQAYYYYYEAWKKDDFAFYDEMKQNFKQ